MAQTNPWELPVAGGAPATGAPAGGPVGVIVPKAPEKPREAPSGYRYNAQGNVEFIPGGPADPAVIAQEATARVVEKGPKMFPEKAAETLTDDINQVDALSRALRGFNDDFAGSAFSSIESLLQGWNSDIGTPGQRDWWSDVKASDNIIRNKLFGASLTPGEQQAYEQTTITPGMDGVEIRKNLIRRLGIVQEATQRRYNRYIAAGYDPAQIDATVGDVDFRNLPNLNAEVQPEVQPDGQDESELIEFTPNPNLVVGMDGRVYDKRTGQPVELPSQGGTSIGESLYAAGGDIAQTAGDVLGLVGNPANAAVNALFGTNLSTNLGETFREATGAPRGDPLASAINRGLGAAMTGLGGASLAARTLPQAGRQIAATLTELPTQQIIGGGTGAAASEIVRQQGGGPVAQTIAGITAGSAPAAVTALRGVRAAPVAQTTAPPTTSAMEALVSPPTGRDIIQAGQEANIPIMTSDIPSRQPNTFIRSAIQRAGERIPIIGTGGVRAAQQQSREAAVQDFLVENAGAIPQDVSERLVKDVVRKNAETVDKYSTNKKEVFANVSTAGTVAPTNVLQKIDEQIASLSSRRTGAGDEAVAKLQELRQKLVDDRDIYQMEAFRRDELGNAWNDSNLSIGASNLVQSAVRKLYKPFNDDMGQFILQNGGKRDYTKWRVANARLSDDLEEAKRKGLKAILQKGEADPQTIDAMLFSGKKSDVSAFYRALTPEGQALARMAIVNRVAEKMGKGSVSPEKFISQLEKQADQIGIFFSNSQQKELKGLVQALNATRRGGAAPVMTQSGQENYIPIVASAFGIGADTFLTGGIGTGLAAVFTAAVRGYETKPIRNLFAALEKTKPGSAQEQAIIAKINQKFAPIIATISSIEAEEEKSRRDQSAMQAPQ
jgi:hypothetical protein